MTRPIFAIAKDIRSNWSKVNYAAEPYLEAMEELTYISDMFMHDTAQSVVRYSCQTLLLSGARMPSESSWN